MEPENTPVPGRVRSRGCGGWYVPANPLRGRRCRAGPRPPPRWTRRTRLPTDAAMCFCPGSAGACAATRGPRALPRLSASCARLARGSQRFCGTCSSAHNQESACELLPDSFRPAPRGRPAPRCRRPSALNGAARAVVAAAGEAGSCPHAPAQHAAAGCTVASAERSLPPAPACELRCRKPSRTSCDGLRALRRWLVASASAKFLTRCSIARSPARCREARCRAAPRNLRHGRCAARAASRASAGMCCFFWCCRVWPRLLGPSSCRAA